MLEDAFSIGCVYSPLAVNLLLEGPDNFVCKLYPVTIRKLGPNVILAKERLITTRSGAFNWPGRPARARLYTYDAHGDLKSTTPTPLAAAANRIDVPPGGMVIAELVVK